MQKNQIHTVTNIKFYSHKSCIKKLQRISLPSKFDFFFEPTLCPTHKPTPTYCGGKCFSSTQLWFYTYCERFPNNAGLFAAATMIFVVMGHVFPWKGCAYCPFLPHKKFLSEGNGDNGHGECPPQSRI